MTDEDNLKFARGLLRRAESAWELRMAQAVVVPADRGLSLEATAQMPGVSTRTVQNLRDRLHRFAQGEEVRGKRGGRHHQN
ncbi:MAG: hypothetical protein LBC18_08975, partial [Opitutaceae bacterium]|nr:hypothetical protein [Opitutaceae bacterium]